MLGNVCLVTHHPFWVEPLGCGTLIRSRYELLKKICQNVYVLYIIWLYHFHLGPSNQATKLFLFPLITGVTLCCKYEGKTKTVPNFL